MLSSLIFFFFRIADDSFATVSFLSLLCFIFLDLVDLVLGASMFPLRIFGK